MFQIRQKHSRFCRFPRWSAGRRGILIEENAVYIGIANRQTTIILTTYSAIFVIHAARYRGNLVHGTYCITLL